MTGAPPDGGRAATASATGGGGAPPSNVLDTPAATRTLIRGSIVRTAAYGVSVLAGLAVLPFLFRHLGVQDTGRYVSVITLVGLVGGVVEAGLAAISMRRFAQRPSAELMRDLIGLRLLAYVACSLLGLGFMVAAGHPGLLVAAAACALLGGAMENVSSTYGVWLSTNLRLGGLAAMQLVRQAAAVALTGMLVVAGAALPAFVAVMAVAGAAQLASGLWLTRGVTAHVPRLRPGAWGPLVRSAGAFVVAMALGVVCYRTAMILVPVLASGREAGYLGVPFRVLDLVALVAVLMFSSTVPVLVRAAVGDRARHRLGLLRLGEAALLAGGLVGLLALVGADVVVAVLAGDGFEPSVPVLRILAISLALKFVIAAWAFALLSLERDRSVLAANAAALVVAVVATVLAVPPLGAVGGALATVACDVTLAGGYVLALARGRVELPLRCAAVVCAAVAGSAGLAFASVGPGPARIAIAAVAFAAAVLALRVVPPELREALARSGGRQFSGSRARLSSRAR